jgi:hypothetical protein
MDDLAVTLANYITSLTNDMLAAVGGIVPATLLVMGGTLVVEFGISAFKSIVADRQVNKELDEWRIERGRVDEFFGGDWNAYYNDKWQGGY